MKTFIYKHFDFFLIISSILSFTAISSLWWLSILSLVFFTWNLINEKRNLGQCIAFLLLTIMLMILNFTISRWGNKVHAEWETGYDSTWVRSSQEAINVIDRSIEKHKIKYGTYPNSLNEIDDILFNNHDLSYRIKEADGQTNGIPFYYEKVDSNKFYLAGVGKDGIIKTDDDLLPQISQEQEKNTGLIKYVVKSFTLQEMEREQQVIEMERKSKKVYDKFVKK